MRKRRVLAQPGPAWRAAEAYGFDMSLVELNLELTPEERIRAHDEVRQLADELREAMRERHAKVH